ncbi:MAG: NAD(P)-dependent oxidoreductase [Alphaproteobacteria bacterium]|nr:NAD(P)-dependent oxidoreductase [Alphaproteobacteria bacterium]
MAENIGFVGVGKMGGPMAGRLLDAGHSLTVYDIREEAMAPLIARGAVRAESSKAVADVTDIVFFSLPEPEDVRGEALKTLGIIAGQRAKILVDLSTTGPRTTEHVAGVLLRNGIAMVDAPVSGGIAGASKGTLAVMASGSAEALTRVEPLLQIFGRVFRIGDRPGMGQVMKLANNLMSATAMAITTEAMIMGVKAGLDPKLMIDVINSGTGRNTASETKFPQAIIPRRFTYGFTTGLMLKDVRLCLEEAEALQIPMVVGDAVRKVWRRAQEELGSDSDYTEIVRCLEKEIGVEIKSPN